MFALRPSKILLVLMVAVWQLCLPLLAYAHMSKAGAMTQEVCTTMGMKTVVLAQDHSNVNSFAAGQTSDSSALQGEHHDCCVFSLHVVLQNGAERGLSDAQPLYLDFPHPTHQAPTPALGLHAPPTGPPHSL